MVEKNAFIVLKVPLLTPRVRLSSDRAAGRRFKVEKRGKFSFARTPSARWPSGTIV